MYQFTSAKKMASILLRQPTGYLLLNKGAAEWVLDKCDSVLDEAAGGVVPLTPELRVQLGATVVAMASRGLRCICLATRTLPLEDASRPEGYFEDSANLDQGMTALAIVGIKDPVSWQWLVWVGCVDESRGCAETVCACRVLKGAATLTASAAAAPSHLLTARVCLLLPAACLQVRVEVPAAVTKCQKAGIVVRMVTGESWQLRREG
jgi:hypothetical protein